MLTLTRKTEYGLIALTHMALGQGGVSSAREIAGRYGVPLALLMNVLKQLAQSGLIHSARGPTGGYSLTLPPEKISLLDIFRAIEGPVHLTYCSGLKDSDYGSNGEKKKRCQIMGNCPVGASIRKVDGRLTEFLEKITLADIIECRTPVEVSTEELVENKV